MATVRFGYGSGIGRFERFRFSVPTVFLSGVVFHFSGWHKPCFWQTVFFFQGRKRYPNPNVLVRIFSGGVGVFRVNGWGPKSSVPPSKPGKSNFSGGISRDFAGVSRRCPKSLRKKVCVQFLAPIFVPCQKGAVPTKAAKMTNLHSSHWNKGFAPPNDENGGCH